MKKTYEKSHQSLCKKKISRKLFFFLDTQHHGKGHGDDSFECDRLEEKEVYE